MRDVAFAIGAGVVLGVGIVASVAIAGEPRYVEPPHDDARMQARTLQQVVDTWRLNHPNDPDQCPTVSTLKREGALKLDQSTNDPWGQPYVIMCPYDAPEVLSAGPDGRYGTNDDLYTGAPQ